MEEGLYKENNERGRREMRRIKRRTERGMERDKGEGIEV